MKTTTAIERGVNEIKELIKGLKTPLDWSNPKAAMDQFLSELEMLAEIHAKLTAPRWLPFFVWRKFYFLKLGILKFIKFRYWNIRDLFLW